MFVLLILWVIWLALEPVSCLICSGIAIIAGVVYLINEDNTSKKVAKIAKNKEQERIAHKKYYESMVQKKIEELVQKYGRLSNTIRLERCGDMPDIKKCLLVFGESELLYVDGREILFKE